MLNNLEAFTVLLVFAACMFLLVFLSKDKSKTTEGFLLANRKLGWKRGAFSIAVSWIWAPAIFISSLKSYEHGLPGAFWFIAPNILCFFVFAPLAIQLRKLLPEGYTLTQLVSVKHPEAKPLHLTLLLVLILNQLFAIIVNATAGGLLLNTLTGVSFSTCVLSLSAIALIYSLINGFKASILTDLIQMIVILIIGFILVPWVVFESGGVNTLAEGIGGITGQHNSLFDLRIALGFGLSAVCTLIFGPVSDQMFFQRALAVKKNEILKTFIAGGLIFGLVPLSLCLLGFVAAAPEVASKINVSDVQMIAPIVIDHFLPKGALLIFTFMALAGLCSTLDSAYCGISALGTIDIYKKYFNPRAQDQKTLLVSRASMLILAIFGTTIALLKPQIIWVFLIYGTMAAAAFFPIVFILYSKASNIKLLKYAILIPLVLGLPLSIYGNIKQIDFLVSYSSALVALISLLICLALRLFPGRVSYN